MMFARVVLMGGELDKDFLVELVDYVVLPVL
jgi:hypothetical protein